MRINFANNTNFYGTKINLDQAKEMCTMVQKEYPYPSLWKQGKFEFKKIVKENPDLKTRFQKLREHRKLMDATLDRLTDLRESYKYCLQNALEYFSRMVDGIKEFKTINCGEAARLVYMIARINGVDEKDVKVAKMQWKKDNEEQAIDHVITKINGESGSVIIDGLLNESGAIEDLEQIYKNNYHEEFNLPKNCKINFIEKEIPSLTDEEAQELRKKHPEFVLKA